MLLYTILLRMVTYYVEIGKSIDALNEQKKLLQSRSEFTHREFSSQSQEIDITEEYDSDTERKWRG